jgi:DNA polymerase III epsilon subunit-like protein
MNPFRITLFDVETTGFLNKDNRLVQFAAHSLMLHPTNFQAFTVQEFSSLVKCDIPVPDRARSIHGISQAMTRFGVDEKSICRWFNNACNTSDYMVAHNYSFDHNFMEEVFTRNKLIFPDIKNKICTMRESAEFCQIPKNNNITGYKHPKLIELHQHLFNEGFDGAHDALVDVKATKRCLVELIAQGVIKLNHTEDLLSNI